MRVIRTFILRLPVNSAEKEEKMNTQKTSKLRRVAWPLAGALAALLLLALLAAGNAVATSAGAGTFNTLPNAASRWRAEAAERPGAVQPGPAAAHPSAMTWHIERMDAPKWFYDMTDRSLRLDAAGHPHIAYGADHLYYAWHDGTTWHLETADASWGVGRYASLALDGSGHPHISYFDGTDYDLKYAFYDGSAWHTQTVDAAGDVGEFTSLALDAAGHPHISYSDETHSDLKYAFFDGSSWHIATVDSAGMVGWYTSLALDSAGHPHISYYDETNQDLKYASYDGGSWHLETVDSAGMVGWCTSLVLDAAGRPHISYYDWTNGDLKYAWGETVTLRFIYLPLVLRNR